MGTTEIIVAENSRKYLSRNLVFPKGKDVDNPGLKFYLKLIIVNLSTIMVLIGILLHFGINIKRKTYINIDLDLAEAIALTGAYVFNFSYVRQVKNTAEVYKLLSDFHTFGIPNNFKTGNERLNFLSKLHYIYITFTVCVFCYAPLTEAGKCERENAEKNLQEICGLLENIWLPLDIEDYARYKWVFYFYQSYAAFIIYQTSSMISFSIVEMVEHLIIKLNHVKHVFLEALAEEDEQIRKVKFGNAVKYHVYVIKISNMVNTSFKWCMFVHVLLTGAILGCVGYRLVNSNSLGAICLFIGWLASLVMVSISGQRLTDQSWSLGDNIYYISEWEHLNKELQRDLAMLILRCQKPIYLHAGPFGYIKYAIVITVLKTSYSYLTLLSQTS